jgi:hypothetical protein
LFQESTQKHAVIEILKLDVVRQKNDGVIINRHSIGKVPNKKKKERKNKLKTTALLATLDCEPQTKTFKGIDKGNIQKSILSCLNKICLFTFTSIDYIFKRECFSDI